MTHDDSATALLSPPVAQAAESAPPARVTSPPRHEPSWIRRGHIPGLDGLRAVAILMVLAAHCSQTPGFPPWPIVRWMAYQAAIGVDVFFVISGFLITTLLARELERDGGIPLQRFYVRRSLRIIPAYVALVLTVAVAHQTGYFQLQTRDWIGATTYTMNFLYHPSWELGHSWSLSVEEHFYLLWPLVLSAGGLAWGWRFGLGCLAGCWLIRCAIAAGLPRLLLSGTPFEQVSLCATMAETWTFTRLDTISVGSLLALYCRSEAGRTRLDRLASPSLLWVIVFCVSVWLMKSARYTLCFAFTVNALCIALLMWKAIRSQGLSQRILANPLLKLIGIGSYSIYLWQQLFLHPRHSGWIHAFPQNLVLALGAAWLSFQLIEQPFNRWKDRIAQSSCRG